MKTSMVLYVCVCAKPFVERAARRALQWSRRVFEKNHMESAMAI